MIGEGIVEDEDGGDGDDDDGICDTDDDGIAVIRIFSSVDFFTIQPVFL